MNPHVSITQFQQLSAYDQSNFIYTPVLYPFNFNF